MFKTKYQKEKASQGSCEKRGGGGVGVKEGVFLVLKLPQYCEVGRKGEKEGVNDTVLSCAFFL